MWLVSMKITSVFSKCLFIHCSYLLCRNCWFMTSQLHLCTAEGCLSLSLSPWLVEEGAACVKLLTLVPISHPPPTFPLSPAPPSHTVVCSANTPGPLGPRSQGNQDHNQVYPPYSFWSTAPSLWVRRSVNCPAGGHHMNTRPIMSSAMKKGSRFHKVMFRGGRSQWRDFGILGGSATRPPTQACVGVFPCCHGNGIP